jgi:2,5-dichlorohydroquinone reductive dechlorinase
MTPEFHGLVKDIRRALGYVGAPEDTSRDGGPRFELFHATKSICAQKVRAVLAHHDLPYLERTMNPLTGENFLPSYVHLRVLGCARIGAPLAETHNGSTSVTSAGCDACVVPTLIDWGTNEVIVDSKRICLYLDELVSDEQKLRPKALAADVDQELALVDDFPNIQMLLGKPPKGTNTAIANTGITGAGFSMSRIEFCKRYLSEFPDDPILVKAYSAKISKERYAAEHLFSDAAVKDAYEHAESACVLLEHKLAQRGSVWLFGDRVTMADIFWGAELTRVKNLGTANFWENGRLPNLAKYVSAAEALASLRSAILEWKGALF